MSAPHSIAELSALWARSRGLDHWHQSLTTSTNNIAKEDSTNAEFKLYVADAQSAGRGRGKNVWINPESGSALLASFCFQLAYIPQPIVSVLTGLSLYRALNSTFMNINWALKAPNDIYIANKKVAGLLIENISQGTLSRLVVGLGLNVYEHPASIETATSICEHQSLHPRDFTETWFEFLDRFHFELLRILAQPKTELNLSERQNLLVALNRFELLNERYVEIESNASLITQSKKRMNWFEL